MKKIVKIVMVLVLGFALLHKKSAANSNPHLRDTDVYRLKYLLENYNTTLDKVKQFFIDNKNVDVNAKVGIYSGGTTTLLHIITGECVRNKKDEKHIKEVKDITEYLILH